MPNEKYEDHQRYLKNQQSFRKYGGIPDSTGKVHDLKDKTYERKINSPSAKYRRSLRNAQYEGNLNRWGEKELARANRSVKSRAMKKVKDKK